MLKWTLLAAVLALGVGCNDDPQDSLHNRQNPAVKDPWNYSPYGEDDRTVSGGGMTDFNAKAFKRDVNSTFGP